MELPLDSLFTMMSPSMGMDPAKIREQYDSGKQAIADADSSEDKLDPMILRALVDGVKMQMEMMPASADEQIDEDTLFEILSEILDETPAKVREMYDNAAP
jgi:hypothetical protein